MNVYTYVHSHKTIKQTCFLWFLHSHKILGVVGTVCQALKFLLKQQLWGRVMNASVLWDSVPSKDRMARGQIFCCGGCLSNGFQFKHLLPELHCCSDCIDIAMLTHEQKTRILTLRSIGKGPSEIVWVLSEDGIKISHCSVIRFLKWYQRGRHSRIPQNQADHWAAELHRLWNGKEQDDLPSSRKNPSVLRIAVFT